MKVGTDGVLLGAWADISTAKCILDIGTGTGLMALMAAQRNPTATVLGIEVDEKSFEEARYNAMQCPWHDRIRIQPGSIQDYALEARQKFDAIISNPPYFLAGVASPTYSRHRARHSHSLTPKELLAAANRLLTTKGTFSIILPFSEGLNFINTALNHGFYPRKKTAFFSKASKPQERWLFEFRRTIGPIEEDALVQYDQNNEWSNAYRSLTSTFYLKL